MQSFPLKKRCLNIPVRYLGGLERRAVIEKCLLIADSAYMRHVRNKAFLQPKKSFAAQLFLVLR